MNIIGMGVNFLMKKNKVDVHHGWGSFVDATHVKVQKEDGEEILVRFRHVGIHTGRRRSMCSDQHSQW